MIAWGYVEDPGLAPVAGVPVGHAPAGVDPGRSPSPLTLVPPVDPKGLSGDGVDGHCESTGTGGGKEDAVDHDGGDPVVAFGRGPEVPGRPPPCDLQLAHVGGVDLVQRRISGAPEIPPVDRPLTSGGPDLRGPLVRSSRE